jgi:undecaprenyl pyrophosphate phosphatase UppP
MNILIDIVAGSLILIWAYSAHKKFRNLPKFRNALTAQVFPVWIVPFLTFGVPLSESAAIGLLLFDQTRMAGMMFSFLLMLAFTLYVGGAVFQVYRRYPCPCGGVFTNMGWKRHLQINMLLTAIALTGLVLMLVE